jgi:hypothetical protein
MSITYEDPPCNLDEIMELSFNFKNLQNFLKSIVNNNKEFFLKIADISTKLDEIGIINNTLKETNIRLEQCESKFHLVDGSFLNHQSKLIELESKICKNSNVRKKFIYFFYRKSLILKQPKKALKWGNKVKMIL